MPYNYNNTLILWSLYSMNQNWLKCSFHCMYYNFKIEIKEMGKIKILLWIQWNKVYSKLTSVIKISLISVEDVRKLSHGKMAQDNLQVASASASVAILENSVEIGAPIVANLGGSLDCTALMVVCSIKFSLDLSICFGHHISFTGNLHDDSELNGKTFSSTW